MLYEVDEEIERGDYVTLDQLKDELKETEINF